MIFKKDGTIKEKYKLSGIDKSKKVYTCHWTRSGKHTNLISCYSNYSLILQYLGIDFEFLNDAPRGGEVGNHIIVKSRVKFNNFIKKHN